MTMNKELEARGMEAIKKYLTLIGYEVLSMDNNGLIVCFDPDETQLTFIEAKVFEKPIDLVDFEKDFNCDRRQYEKAMWSTVTDPEIEEEYKEISLRTDQLALCIATPNRAMVAHHVNAQIK